MSSNVVTIGVKEGLRNGLRLMAFEKSQKVGFRVWPGAVASQILAQAGVPSLTEKELEVKLRQGGRKKLEVAS